MTFPELKKEIGTSAFLSQFSNKVANNENYIVLYVCIC